MSTPDLRALALSGTVHFVGIGGAGMCALAELLVRDGGAVSGCDLKRSEALDRLEGLGARVSVGHDPAHVTEAAALVVTSAVPADHAELAAARARGIPVVKRAAALASVVREGRVVAIAGTHGKTSTTALTVEVLAAAGRDPTGFVGGTVRAWQGNLRVGASDLFVVEADEFDRSFHALEPDLAVVTNLEADHLDIYGDLAGVRSAFELFLDRLRPGGRTILCADDPGAAALAARQGDRVITYGLGAGSELRADEVEARPGGTTFRVWERGRDAGRGHLATPGLHALRNALAAAAVARELGVEWDAIHAAWSRFAGVARRFERLGKHGGVTVIDDYAHHPTEIRVTLTALRDAFGGRRLVAVFQPHLYSRTRDFAEDFGAALAVADRVWVTDVFPAREAPIPGVDGALVVAAVERAGGKARLHGPLEGLAASVAEELEPEDVVVTLGAGSIERIGPELVRELEVARV